MIKAIIFDLGGVILDLHFDQMVQRFEQLGVKDFKKYFNLTQQNDFFEALELGKISPETFYEKFRIATGTACSDQEIERAWNLILGNFKTERMNLLTDLSANLPLYLFSNTNAIHAQCFEKRCLAQTGKNLSDYFTQTYYSHDLHLRKPTVESFKAVLQHSGHSAKEVLFIDDNEANIRGAAQAGLNTYHLQTPETLTDLDFTKLLDQFNS